MARYGDLGTQYFDDAGDPLVNGKVYFYETGTTTLKATYADVDYTIANTNPVILTAAGRQPNIFFEGVAKAILATSAGTQILVRDPVGDTAESFGNPWISSKRYSANDVVQGSDGQYYVSLINGNVNLNPVTTTGNWTFLYSVEWNAGTTYKEGSVITYQTLLYQSLQSTNLNRNPVTETTYWVIINLAYVSTVTYTVGQNVVGPDGVFYTALRTTIGDTPASSPSDWVGTSAAAAASATAAAASATSAAASASTATTQASNASTSAATATTQATNAAASAATATTQASNASTSASNASTSATNAAASASTASTQASNASTSATSAASSATSATASASTATTQASNASTSASNASTSASNASTSETNAAASASTATTQASNASTSASTATTQAGLASTSASTATTQAGIATTQAGIATTQAGIATTQASNAAASAVSADASAVAAAASAASIGTTTGTGSLVRQTSPTLITPALGTPSAIVLTNASGTASININGTVGATTQNTGAFTALSATGLASLGSTGTNTPVLVGKSATDAYGIVSLNASSTPASMLGLYGTSTDTTLYIKTPTGGGLSIQSNNVVLGAFTSTGLAVTGTLSATGNISSSGYGLFTGIVSVGNATPVYQLDLNTTGSNTLFGAGISASTTPGPMTLSINSWGQSGGRTGVITFVTGGVSNGVEAARITSDAYLRMASGSSGIQFNGDTAAANALDDYEEGTWTPVLAGSSTAGTYTYDADRTNGRYVKIGKVVILEGVFRVSTVSSAGVGDALITGLPFTTSAIDTAWVRLPGNLSVQSGPTLAGDSLLITTEADGAAYLALRLQTTSSISAIDVTDADFVEAVWFFQITYETA